MKLVFLIVTSILLSVTEFIMLCIVPKRTHKIVFSIIALIVFLVVIYIHSQFIYNLGVLWGLQIQSKVILGISYGLTLIASVIYK